MIAPTMCICPAGEVFNVLNRAVARLTIFEMPEDCAAFMRVLEITVQRQIKCAAWKPGLSDEFELSEM